MCLVTIGAMASLQRAADSAYSERSRHDAIEPVRKLDVAKVNSHII